MDSVLRVLHMKYNILKKLKLQFQDVFFTDPDSDFSGSDPDFWPIWIRIRTQKKSRKNPEKPRKNARK